MALPASGDISFNNINVELGLTATAQVSLNDSAVRTLFGIASGQIDMNTGHGKSNRVARTITIASNTTNYTLNTAAVSGYTAGKTDVTLVVNSGIYLYSTSTATPALTIGAFNAADTVTIVNNGYIIGMGGNGGYPNGVSAGGPAMSLGFSVSVTNNSYIAGGGGGGGYNYMGGGGGAGGGIGGGQVTVGSTTVSGGAGGAPGSAGGNGGAITNAGTYYCGGGGGRILPGTGGTGNGGGGSGGAGGGYNRGGGSGGSANAAGSNSPDGNSGAGGGGWGASGGSGSTAAGGGGKAVNLNGFTVTWTVTGTRYGAIS